LLRRRTGAGRGQAPGRPRHLAVDNAACSR